MARGRQLKKEISKETVILLAVANDFFNYNKAKGLSEASQKAYRNYVNSFIKWCGEDADISILNIRTIDRYLSNRTNEGLKTISIATTMRHIRTFINFCASRGYIENFEITIPKFEEELKDPYTDEEMKKLLKKPKGKDFVEYRCWVMTNYFFSTGQRLSTVLNIKVKDLDLNNSKVKLEWNKDKIKKWMPLSSAIVKILREYIQVCGLEEEDYLFPEYEGKQLKARSCQDAMADYNKRRGVERTGIHLFRHTFAKNYIMAGGNPVKLQKLLNHKTIDMTMKYVNLYGEDISKDLDLFNPLDNFKRKNYTPTKRRTI